MTPALSIIIPVYNAEQTLSACIDKIITQSFTSWELLLVDDGSKDSSSSICDVYAQKDSRIQVFHKPNGGVSSARNIGLENARGEWISFIDADDYISDSYFNPLQLYDTDFIILQNQHFHIGETPYEIEHIENFICNDKEATIAFLSTHLHYHIMMVPWGKFFRRSLIGERRFLLGQRLGEDVIFVLTYLRQCKSLTVDNSASYYYLEDLSDKYMMGIDDSLRHLNNIYEAYKKLDFVSPDFCLFELSLFTRLSRNEIATNPAKWFRNSLVNNVHNECKQLKSKKDRLKFQLYKIRLFLNIYYRLKHRF